MTKPFYYFVNYECLDYSHNQSVGIFTDYESAVKCYEDLIKEVTEDDSSDYEPDAIYLEMWDGHPEDDDDADFVKCVCRHIINEED